eukprot:tig00000889_g5312.t1
MLPARHVVRLLPGRLATPANAGLVIQRSIHLSRPLARFEYDNAPMPPSRRRGQDELPMNYGIRIVPQQSAYLIERFGRFHRTLEPGLHFLIPLVDRIAYIHSLKEEAVPVQKQTAITHDNVTLEIDGVLYYRITDPVKASYGIEDPLYAVTQLAQTTMRSELGKITLDMSMREREMLNQAIVQSINQAAAAWGIECLRYEIRDITPPAKVKQAMDLQAEAERRKRALILESEGEKESEINRAEGLKQSTVLASEALRQEAINRAHGEAEAIAVKARATAEGIAYVAAFREIAQKGNTLLLPANVQSPAAMVAEALSIYSAVAAGRCPRPRPAPPLPRAPHPLPAPPAAPRRRVRRGARGWRGRGLGGKAAEAPESYVEAYSSGPQGAEREAKAPARAKRS